METTYNRWTDEEAARGILLSREKGQTSAIRAYAPTSNAEEAEAERCYKDRQDLSELTPKKDVLFTTGDWNAKVGSQKHLEEQANLALEYRMKQSKC